MRRLYCFIILLFCTCDTPCIAQVTLPCKPVFREYNTENGSLSALDISSFTLDHYGYLWVAADKNLLRYNGRVFEQVGAGFEQPLYRMQLLSGDLMLLFFRDGHTRGINTRSFTVVNTDSLYRLPPVLPADKPYAAAFEHNRELLLVKKRYADSSRNIPFQVLISGSKTVQAPDRVTAGGWVRRFVFGNNPGPDAARLWDNWLASLSFLKNQRKAVFIGRQLYDSTGRLRFDSRWVGDEKLVSAALINGKRLWLGFLNGGIGLYEHFSDSGIQSVHHTYLEDYLIGDIVKEQAGDLWVFSLGHGLLRFKNEDIGVHHYTHAVSGLSSDQADMIRQLPGGWLAVYNDGSGMLDLVAASGMLSHRKMPGQLKDIRLLQDKLYLFCQEGIYSMPLKAGEAAVPVPLIATDHAGSWRDNTYAGGRLYHLFDNGLFYLDERGKPAQQGIGLPEDVRTVQPLSDTVFLFGTTHGIYRNDRKLPWLEDTWFTRVRLIGGKLICCTRKGVFVADTGMLDKAAAPRLLSPETAVHIRESGDRIFLLTGHGIVIADSKTQQVIASRSFLDYTIPFNIADLCIAGNRVLVAGNAGVFSFPDTQLVPQAVLPLQQIYILNSLNHNIPGDSVFECFYADRLHPVFQIGMPNGKEAGQDIMYRALKDGLDFIDWQTAPDAAATLALDNPLPGTYRVQYRISGTDNKNQRTLSYTFVVKQHWWQTLWAKGLAVFLLVLLLLIAVQRYLRRKMWQQEEIHAAALRCKELEAQALFAQLNTHFVFNALVPFQEYIVTGNRDGALAYVNKFAYLIRSILKNSRMKSVTLGAELRFLDQYLSVQQQRYRNFEYKISVEGSVVPDLIEIPPLFIQPILENAVEHGVRSREQEGWIYVNINLSGKTMLHVTVRDNGSGFADNQSTPEHHALQIIRERLELMAKKHPHAGIILKNSPEGGAMVVLNLPCTILSPDQVINSKRDII